MGPGFRIREEYVDSLRTCLADCERVGGAGRFYRHEPFLGEDVDREHAQQRFVFSNEDDEGFGLRGVDHLGEAGLPPKVPYRT